MDERVTVAEAAERLGLSKEAVRKRISRGTLLSDRGEDGTVQVYVPVSPTASGTRSESGSEDLLAEKDRRIEEQERQLEFYRRILEGEQESSRELRRIVAVLTQRIPELEAPPRTSEEVQDVADTAPEGSSTAEAREEAERAARRPWWRRIFG